MGFAAALALTVALVAGTDSPPKKAPGPKYRLDLSQSTKRLKAGEKGSFQLKIEPAEGYKISTEAPLKVSLKSAGLELEKSELSKKDNRAAKKEPPRFSVGFSTKTQGDQQVEGRALFFVCNEELCERIQEQFTVAVQVAD